MNMTSEGFRDKLAKRPLLLVAVTSSLSFSIQFIPLKAVTNSLCKNYLSAVSAFSYSRLLQFMKFSCHLFSPPVPFAIVCLMIFFIMYISHRDNGEYIKPDRQNHSLVVLKESSLARTAIVQGHSIITQFIPPPADIDKFRSIETLSSLDHEIIESRAYTSKQLTTFDHEEKIASNNSEKKQRSVRGASRTNSKLQMSAHPATSVRLMDSRDPSKVVINTSKLDFNPKSFRRDYSRGLKQDLSCKSFDTLYLRSSCGCLIRPQDESLAALTELNQLDNCNMEPEAINLNSCSKPRINHEASPYLNSSLSFHVASSNTEPKQRLMFPQAEPNDDQHVTEAEVIKGNHDYVEAGFHPRKQAREGPLHQRRQRYSRTCSDESSNQEILEYDPKETSRSEPKQASSQLMIRGESLENDNQKFELFIQNFRNELRLQNLHLQPS